MINSGLKGFVLELVLGVSLDASNNLLCQFNLKMILVLVLLALLMLLSALPLPLHKLSSPPSTLRISSPESQSPIVVGSRNDSKNLTENEISGMPVRCEMCDASVPSEAARFKHMKETRHCACQDCDAYIPLGGIYDHYVQAHLDITWNDHQVVYGDTVNLRNAMEWARRRYQETKSNGQRI